MISEKVVAHCDWYIYDSEGRQIMGPVENSITSQGLAAIAAGLSAVPAPYLVVGDDAAAYPAITEVFRKAVSSVVWAANVVRFRTSLSSSECNGDHTKACIYSGATAVAGTGAMLNMLVQDWSKATSEVITVEARFTISGGVG